MERVLAALLLLLFMLPANDAQAEELEKISTKIEKAERVKTLLINLGFSHKDLKEIANFAEDKIDGEFIYLSSNNFDMSGSKFEFGLRHNLDGADLDNLQLYLQPADSNYILTINHEALMLNYRSEFSW